MKLNRILLGLFIVPALTFVGCGDYEDSEFVSPQADGNALGANFDAVTTSVVVHPSDKTFELTLNRVNTEKAATVPVEVVSCDEVGADKKFCEQPIAFVFEAGKSKSTITLKFDDACEFQKTYEMALSIGEAKDHPYADGTSSTTIFFSIDYAWVELAKPVILETGWTAGEEAIGMLAPIEWASDYKDETGNQLFRVRALYTQGGDILFRLNESFEPVDLFTSVPAGYNPAVINTGVMQNEPKEGEEPIYYFMNVKHFTQDSDTKAYLFTYDIFYNQGGEIVTGGKDTPLGVTALLDCDIKEALENFIKKFVSISE